MAAEAPRRGSNPNPLPQDGEVPFGTLPEAGFRVEAMDDIEAESLDVAKSLLLQIHSTGDANQLYQKVFQLLKQGGLAAEIPRMVVFGQQSMGKTTLLDYIMGGPIGYSSTTTGTRHPVVIFIRPPDESQPNRASCVLNGQHLDVSELQEAMRVLMESSKTISADEIELEMCVPGAVHAVFVDLPGLKDDSKEGAELTRSVVRSYVKNNPYDLYMLVKKASDDPANWPWQLREFILKEHPRGLGLKPKQTLVVGTRALNFIEGEKNDVSTQADLMKRVTQRAVLDASGSPLPLFLLELFSLSKEDKDSFDFDAKKENMYNQIFEARGKIMDLLDNYFKPASSNIRQELYNYFDIELFKTTLNNKFQALLNEQLASLERRLHKKRIECQRNIAVAEDRLTEKESQSYRELIKLFIRELLQIVTELVTGNYNHVIMKDESSGDEFLLKWGGNLEDNLRDGHELAMELFNKNELYERNFIDKVLPPGSTDPPEELKKKLPQQGQAVRVQIQQGFLYGSIQSIPEAAAPTTAHVLFYTRSGSQQQQSKDQKAGSDTAQVRTVEMHRLHPLVPLAPLVRPLQQKQGGYAGIRLWHRAYREDGWVALQAVQLKNFTKQGMEQIAVVTLLTPMRPADQQNQNQAGGPGGEQQPPPQQQQQVGQEFSCKIEDLLVDANPQDPSNTTVDTLGGQGGYGEGGVASGAAWMTPTGMSPGGVPTLYHIAGDYATMKLLNQLSLTHLGRWLKFHVGTLEPDKRFSEHVLLQMMRSVRHVVDKADWEPLVADLLQVNVRGGMLFLARLSACATAVALRRILRASVHEVRRLIDSEELSASLRFLSESEKFIGEVEVALDDYCNEKAMSCADTMRDLIFEQTHAIHFEMIEDFFTGCEQFEKDFIGSNRMMDVVVKVKEGLLGRKSRLGQTDVYARRDEVRTPANMIYDEVRIQFWVVKMLLAAPLTTKLYMHFVKDIKDKSQHLASELRTGMSAESILETYLQNALLCEKQVSGKFLPRLDDDLEKYYEFDLKKTDTYEKLQRAKRVDEYVKLALEGVSRLRAQMSKQGGVDFLMKLEGESGTSPTRGKPPPPLDAVSIPSPNAGGLTEPRNPGHTDGTQSARGRSPSPAPNGPLENGTRSRTPNR
uniref:Dynamin N-terminal domain-containing protein n=1 Tax=Chromera velia CCMP2878 TaxID=1169474 RepID=A0A0G4HF37_9ALVE|eukprot:Cvel_6569.t1-p1 / transcript=Cvel_6569.t1 / gene=Cvel_6569 / organism=Chromera_velia_CCMP2878 / gene_product=Dynamin-related protein 1E, putative / transcript_product=Dynamin-related protein 1E, putative / location=Cvel_scaffold324:6675-15415(+) / protein_length=1131 / sequence_SO=supercontig / SO=protein_coding / is_pseudo=false